MYLLNITASFQRNQAIKFTFSKTYASLYQQPDRPWKKRSRNTRGVLHHYVQLFYLWFPQNIISILLHTMHVNKVQWINFKDKKKRKKSDTKKTGGDFDHEERHWLRYCMYNTSYFIYRATDAMATVCCMLKRLRSCTEVGWALLHIVVCVCEGQRFLSWDITIVFSFCSAE